MSFLVYLSIQCSDHASVTLSNIMSYKLMFFLISLKSPSKSYYFGNLKVHEVNNCEDYACIVYSVFFYQRNDRACSSTSRTI